MEDLKYLYNFVMKIVSYKENIQKEISIDFISNNNNNNDKELEKNTIKTYIWMFAKSQKKVFCVTELLTHVNSRFIKYLDNTQAK